jgi:rare lipoprotein A
MRLICLWLLVVATSFVLVACASSARHGSVKRYSVVSWYGPGFHGKLTASGERYDMNAMTCAHKTLPFGTILSLTNIDNGKTARVTVNDRGPFVRGRDIDVSRAAAKKLDILGAGTGKVRVTMLGRDSRYNKYIEDGKKVQRSTGASSSSTRQTKRSFFTIQVASFSDKSNAQYLEKGLRLNYKRVKIIEKWINGKRYYRVRVGKFWSEDRAQSTASQLAEEGYSANIVPF